MSANMVAVSAVIPTRNRAAPLRRTLESLANQNVQPVEIICIDASENAESKSVCAAGATGLKSAIVWAKADKPGAASQRNQGVLMAKKEVIWFVDDDVLFEKDCVERLWNALQSEDRLGGVNAMITNQSYHTPGFISRCLFVILSGKRETSFAGRLIGPALNLLPEDRDDLPNVVEVDWLNTTCTMYRAAALPCPTFDLFFSGYSIMEDVTLSQRVSNRGWKLANARTARIFHDSQPGEHKSNICSRAEMELTNRHFVMKYVMHRHRIIDYLKLAIWEFFSLASLAMRARSRKDLPAVVQGKVKALREIIFQRRNLAP
jgi:glycosyltransferase involved in cell wall biosynthesis